MLAVVLSACQPAAPPLPSACLPDRPAPGEVVVGVLACAEQVPEGGEGRLEADLYLATSAFRAVLRHPQDALTLRAKGGGTVIDLAPWGGPDVLHEAVPLVAGGWLEHVELTLLADGVEVEGVDPQGAPRQVTYRADGPWLVADGAGAWRLDPAGDVEVLGGLVLGAPTVVGAVAEVLDDGLLTLETDRLLVSTDTEAFSALAGDAPRRISGIAPGAQRLTLLQDGRPVGRLPLPPSGAFETFVPGWVQAVRADAVGHAPSEVVGAGEGLVLPVGAAATLHLVPAWEGPARRLTARTVDAEGLERVTVLEPEGGPLPLGVGVHALTLSAGPAFEPLALVIELTGDETLGVRLTPELDPADWVPISLARPADRSREWRGSDLTALRLASGEGLVYATFAPEADVSSVDLALPLVPELVAVDGSTYAGDGWSVSAWPWNASTRKALHGSVAIPELTPSAAAAAMEGGSADRTLLVDLGWLAAVGAPHRVSPTPELVRLSEGDPEAWAPWFRWLDAGRALIPTGPYTWVPVADPAQVAAADVEQPLLRGEVSAGNGPLLWLTVDGQAPGEVLVEDTGASSGLHTVTVEVRGERPDHLALITDGGARVEVDEGRSVHALPGRWVVLAGWSDEVEGPWGVTGPVWTEGR